jgi:hypothetical protein
MASTRSAYETAVEGRRQADANCPSCLFGDSIATNDSTIELLPASCIAG